MSKKQPLNNAAEIIERFGGIRPMAAKIETPVTTVQGWKKRDVIPGTRRDQIMQAAEELNIDLSDVSNDTVAVTTKAKPQSSSAEKAAPKKEDSKSEARKLPRPEEKEKPAETNDVVVETHIKETPKQTASAQQKPTATNQDDILSAIEANNRKTLAMSAWIAVAMILIAAVVIFFFFRPTLEQQSAEQLQILKEQNEELSNLKAEMQNVNERTSFISNIIPEGVQAGLQEKMNGLQTQARNIQITVDQLAERADEISSEISASLLGPDAGPLAQRLEMLEEKMSEFSAAGNFGDLVDRIGTLEGTIIGQEQIKASVAELQDIVTNMDSAPNADSLNENLEEAQQDDADSALSQTLQGVSGNDLKAAAMLIAFSQLRDSLNREAPFENDLALLERLVGKDNVELQSAINKLAPHADGGVLTAEGLSGEFKGLTGDILEASLKGEDISFTERAKARLGNLMSVEKDGELIGATDTQAAVTKAQRLLDEGNIQAAISELQTLEGPAAEQAQPFIDQANISLLAERVQEMMGVNILSSISNQMPNIEALQSITESQTTTERGFNDLIPALEMPQNLDMDDVKRKLEEAVPNMGNEVIKDDASGITILPNQQGFKGFSSGDRPSK